MYNFIFHAAHICIFEQQPVCPYVYAMQQYLRCLPISSLWNRKQHSCINMAELISLGTVPC